MNNHSICITCGTQFPETQPLPHLCPICDDDRQFVNLQGQSWTNLDEIKSTHSNKISKINDRLYRIKTIPEFAIGQQAFLVLSPNGNVLWDCIPLLDKPAIDFIRSVGGLMAIAFSHPHFYSTMNEWAETFNCPVYIHQNDESYIFNPGKLIQLWQGDEKVLWDDIRITHIGGHFPGSSVLHVGSLSPGGTILCGDTLYIAPSKQHIAVMYSYPNRIILPKTEFESVYKKCSALSFDTLHGASFEGQSLEGNAREIFDASMKRSMYNYNN